MNRPKQGQYSRNGAENIKKGVIRIYLRRKKVEMNKVIIKAHSNFARRQKFDLVKKISKYRKHYTVS